MVGIIYTFFLVNERNIVIDYTKKELLTYRLITSLQFFKYNNWAILSLQV